MITPKLGEVYYSHRSDIDPPKGKYQLYFDSNTVLLINTEKSKRNVSVFVKQSECALLEYDSFINIDTVFKYEKQYPALRVSELSKSALVRLKDMIGTSNLMSRKQIKLIREYIEQIL